MPSGKNDGNTIHHPDTVFSKYRYGIGCLHFYLI
ncbi:hypothetical protein FPSM_00492 [Flavobacterium psychrophilum]|nr:hypothetical protein FPSM_00492 [Flavobacterium psychrophilum]